MSNYDVVDDDIHWNNIADSDDFPITIFLSVTPNKPVYFLLNIMLMIKEFETELQLCMQRPLRESLISACLIGDKTDT